MKEQKVNVSSPELLQFYKAWDAWADEAVETGQAPDHMSFDTWHGLCGCLEEWVWDTQINIPETGALSDELHSQFHQAGLEVDYPFGGRTTFFDEVDLDTMHCNHERRKWVKARISDAEVANG